MDVLDSDWAPEGSSVLRRERKSDEELVQAFWTEMGYPTPESRFWEQPFSPSTGKDDAVVVACRDMEEGSMQDAKVAVSSSSRIIDGARGTGERARRAVPRFPVPRRPRAGSWRGPCPPRRITPLPVFGQFLLKAGWSPEDEVTSPACGSDRLIA
jgi:hypothetical protein